MRGLALLMALGMAPAFGAPLGDGVDSTDPRRALDPAHDVGFLLARADVMETGRFQVRATQIGALLTLSYVPVEALQLSVNVSPVATLATVTLPIAVSAKWAFLRGERLVVSGVASMVGIVGAIPHVRLIEHGSGGGPALGAAVDAYVDDTGRFGLHASVLQLSPLVYVGSAGSHVAEDLLVVATAGASLRLGDSVFLLLEMPLVMGAVADAASGFAEAGVVGGLRVSGTRWALDLGLAVVESDFTVPLLSLTRRN